MILEQLPLSRQLDIAFRELTDELSTVSSGIVYFQIRNNVIGKFGLRHNPIEGRNGEWLELHRGLSEMHQQSLRRMGMKFLQRKRSWTHGEILFEFALQNERLTASVTFESNYNMNNLLQHKSRNA